MTDEASTGRTRLAGFMWRHLPVRLLLKVRLPDEALPGEAAVCLLDVDLAGPTEAGLRRIFPCLAPGGVIYIDDCEDGARTGWRARDGYASFCREQGIPERFDAGFGIGESAA